MNRTEHLKFCNICIHQKDDMRKGIICGLTGQIADFEDICNSLIEDPEIIEQLKMTEIENEVIAKMASQWKRFMNYLLDMVFVVIIIFIFFLFLGMVLAIVSPSVVSNFRESNVLFEYFISFITIMIYYTTYETITGRTIAKYITKTKIVTELGEKPNFKTILIRSLCRFIPIEPFSILFNDGSCWHDTISKTKVINI